MIKKSLRIIVGSIAFCIGSLHFIRTSEMAVYVPLPYGAVTLVYIVGLITVFASFGIIVNKHLKGSLIVFAIVMSFSAFLVQIPIFLREREYLLRVIGLLNLAKLGLAIILLFIAMYYKKIFFSIEDS